ncbi:MAG: cation diffusion facilitator family transporter [Oscillospiraceae bacterium]
MIIDTHKRAHYGKIAGIVGIVCNTLLCIGKFIAGVMSGSVSITADAANNLTDALSSVISLVGFRLSEKRPDEEHPFGHARYEYIAGFVVAVMVMVIGVELLRGSIGRIIKPQPVEFSVVSVVVLAVSILVKLGMMLFNTSMGKRIDSHTLIATAADSRNDCITTAAVLAAAIISHYADVQLDGIMGTLVAAFILYSGAGLVRNAMDPLLGNAPDPKLVESIREKILTYPGVLGAHDLIVHDYGHGRQFATVHVEMAAENSAIDSHNVIDRMEREFQRDMGLNMLVHFDPVVTKTSEVKDLRRELDGIVLLIDQRLSVHDLRVVPSVTETRLIFDVVVPKDFSMSEQELKDEITRFVHRRIGECSCTITIDSSFAPIQR